MARVSVNTALLATVLLLAATGTVELFGNSEALGWVYAVHRGAAFALLVLLVWKMPIARRSLRRRGPAFDVWPGLLLAATILGLVFTGSVWLAGAGAAWDLAGNSLLALHLDLYYLLALPLAWHLLLRWERPRAAAFRTRRAILRLGATAGAGVVAAVAFTCAAPWLFRFPPPRRFTGSFVAGGGTGNDFPITAFLADDPAPVDVSVWRLRVTGKVSRPLALRYDDVASERHDVAATIDCTGGWCARRIWSGASLASILDEAGVASGAALVLVHSLTCYFTVLPIGEARRALLATHVGGEPLSHGHGFPLRLVAPQRRGFQWVKWVDSVQVV